MSYPFATRLAPGLHARQRPRLLNAVAVSGMVIAVTSFVASLITIAVAVAMYKSSNSARDRLLRNAPAAMPTSTPGEPVSLTAAVITPIGQNGMDGPRRAQVVDVISTKIQMSVEQAGQLDALLAERGDEVFQGQDALTAIGDRIGLLPSSDTNEFGPVFFETSAGRVELYSGRALFYPRSTIRPVRVTAGRQLNAAGCPVLLPQDVEALTELIRVSCHDAMNGSQVQTLRGLLEDSNQHVVAINRNPDGSLQIGLQNAVVRPPGYACVYFAGGPILLSPSGRLILQSNRDSIPAVDGRACLLVVVEGILSLAGAIFLLMISVSVLRNPAAKFRRFLYFSKFKLVLSVLSGVAVGWMVASYARSAAQLMPASLPPIEPCAIGIGVGAMGVIYSIVLAACGRAKAIREYDHPTA